MGRKRVWPPRVYPHAPSGRERIRVDGVDYWLGPIGSDEARREYGRLVKELSEGGGPPTKKADTGWPTLLAVVSAFVENHLPGCSVKEQGHYRHMVAVLLAGGRGKMRSDRFDVAELAKVRDEMMRAPRRTSFASRAEGADAQEGCWSRNHVNRQVVRLRTMWRWAEERGHAPKGSWAHLRTLRSIAAHDRSARHTARVRPAYEAELDAVTARIGSKAVKAMLRLQWLTGMRSGELRQMRPCDIDRTNDVWLYRPKRHKNAWRGQERVVPLGAAAQLLLGPLLEGLDAEQLVFRTRKGGPITSPAYGQITARAAKKVGLNWLRPYCFRHGAKQRITRESGLDAARAMLGQKHIGTTNDYGDALDLSLAIEAARKAG